MPSSPGNVVPVREVAGERRSTRPTSARRPTRATATSPSRPPWSPGGRSTTGSRFDVNPTSRQILPTWRDGHLLGEADRAGARLHQAGCNGCIGMGQAPATGTRSACAPCRATSPAAPARARTRSACVSPETAAASALTGVITDPRDPGHAEHPRIASPSSPLVTRHAGAAAAAGEARRSSWSRGPNIAVAAEFDPLPGRAGAAGAAEGRRRRLDRRDHAGRRPRAAVPQQHPEISEFCFDVVDETYPTGRRRSATRRARVVGGDNYGQGSSREHAALAPRYLGCAWCWPRQLRPHPLAEPGQLRRPAARGEVGRGSGRVGRAETTMIPQATLSGVPAPDGGENLLAEFAALRPAFLDAPAVRRRSASPPNPTRG
jgi:aconitate hydratase